MGIEVLGLLPTGKLKLGVIASGTVVNIDCKPLERSARVSDGCTDQLFLAISALRSSVKGGLPRGIDEVCIRLRLNGVGDCGKSVGVRRLRRRVSNGDRSVTGKAFLCCPVYVGEDVVTHRSRGCIFLCIKSFSTSCFICSISPWSLS